MIKYENWESYLILSLLMITFPLWFIFFLVLGIFQRHVYGTEPSNKNVCDCFAFPSEGHLGEAKER